MLTIFLANVVCWKTSIKGGRIEKRYTDIKQENLLNL